jgi:ArsR family transcriptional regulator, arsenate/arsenite/antimonite-responsive transcriptional repressor
LGRSPLDISIFVDILADVKQYAKAARLFHALSDETRLAILDRLRNGERCVCDLMELLGAGQSRLSFHMKVLKDAGLVEDWRHGRWIHYALKPEGLEAAEQTIASLMAGKSASETAACCAK